MECGSRDLTDDKIVLEPQLLKLEQRTKPCCDAANSNHSNRPFSIGKVSMVDVLAMACHVDGLIYRRWPAAEAVVVETELSKLGQCGQASDRTVPAVAKQSVNAKCA